MKRRFLILLILCLVGLTGCTVPGPSVYEYGYDGEGNLVLTEWRTRFPRSAISLLTSGMIDGENPQTIVIKSPKK